MFTAVSQESIEDIFIIPENQVKDLVKDRDQVVVMCVKEVRFCRSRQILWEVVQFMEVKERVQDDGIVIKEDIQWTTSKNIVSLVGKGKNK